MRERNPSKSMDVGATRMRHMSLHRTIWNTRQTVRSTIISSKVPFSTFSFVKDIALLGGWQMAGKVVGKVAGQHQYLAGGWDTPT